MDTRELAKIDLNLLISLQVLLEEHNVSRAAERLYITQPAMSKTLSRLRTVFNDPLFTRCSHGMQPTPRAMEIALGLPEDEVRRVIRLIDLNEYKRRLSPPGVRITAKAFGKDRRLPITNHYRQK